MGGVRQAPPQLPPPQLSVVSGQLSVVNGSTVPGSALFYTLDGTNPSPRNPAAQLLIAPFAVSVGTTVTARAWLAGYLASDTTAITA